MFVYLRMRTERIGSHSKYAYEVRNIEFCCARAKFEYEYVQVCPFAGFTAQLWYSFVHLRHYSGMGMKYV